MKTNAKAIGLCAAVALALGADRLGASALVGEARKQG